VNSQDNPLPISSYEIASIVRAVFALHKRFLKGTSLGIVSRSSLGIGFILQVLKTKTYPSIIRKHPHGAEAATLGNKTSDFRAAHLGRVDSLLLLPETFSHCLGHWLGACLLFWHMFLQQ